MVVPAVEVCVRHVFCKLPGTLAKGLCYNLQSLGEAGLLRGLVSHRVALPGLACR